MTKLLLRNIDFKKILFRYESLFLDNFNIIPVLGCELEFYSKIPEQKLHKSISNEISAEEGDGQFELKFSPVKSPLKLVENIEATKRDLQDIAIFSATPYVDQPSSGMHIHINFLDAEQNNIYIRTNSKTPKALAYSIGGLLNTMEESCVFFAPTQNSYQRFTNPSMTAPSKISWGINNRTAAIRITPMEKGPRRIECRIASSNAEPAKVIAAILAGIHLGLTEKIIPQEPTYGICSDPQYRLKDLPKSLAEAKKLAMRGNISSLLTSMLVET
jgi:glutamine synthetase